MRATFNFLSAARKSGLTAGSAASLIGARKTKCSRRFGDAGDRVGYGPPIVVVQATLISYVTKVLDAASVSRVTGDTPQ
jgi:hypothetical protein